MDIIDILLARALSPQGQIESAAATATAAVSKANTLVNNIEGLEDRANDAAQLAESAYSDLQEALSALNNLITVSGTSLSDAKQRILSVNTDGNTVTYIVEKNYTTSGQNEDGAMTQKAITNFVNAAIANIPTGSGSGGGISNLGPENSGKIVIVGGNGNITAGAYTLDQLVESLHSLLNSPTLLSLNYDSSSAAWNEDYYDAMSFDKLLMYTGRRRCTVQDDGTITAFYGEPNYTEDGSQGQVMVYQPKFSYRRTPTAVRNILIGQSIKAETLTLSDTFAPGFKLHPIFIDANGRQLEYVLFSAYEAGLFDTSANTYDELGTATIDFNSDKLTSIPGIKPVSGVSNTLTLTNAKKLAENRGTGWRITNIKAESANQMLEMMESESANMQISYEEGICNFTNTSTYCYAADTGATQRLGNYSGAATAFYHVNGDSYPGTSEGQRAISYRGMENPWGNIWKMIDGIEIRGDGSQQGGIPYIYDEQTQTYKSAEFCLPSGSNGKWASEMGLCSEDCDWLYMPSAYSDSANQLHIIGDALWTSTNLNGTNIVAIGGNWAFQTKNGAFYYACDFSNANSSARTYGTRLLYIPDPTAANYDTNYRKWQNELANTHAIPAGYEQKNGTTYPVFLVPEEAY